jgi:galactokinase
VSEALILRGLSDIARLKAQLASRGLSAFEAEKKAEMFVACAKALQDCGLGGATAAKAFYVPGRIEVLGKHTDYAGGRSLLAATEKGFCFVAAKQEDATVRVFDVAGGEDVQFAVSDRLERRIGHWSNYPMTVACRLAKNFPPELRGADIAFLSDLPPAAGMSSSSVMLVGFFLILSAFSDLASRKEYRANIHSPEDLASYLGTVENGQTFGTLVGEKGVGTFGGSEDHTAMLYCRAGLLSQYSYCPVRLERTIGFPSDYVFAVGSSGVVAEKTGSAMEKYNRASRLCRTVIELWNEATGRKDEHIAAAMASSADAAEHFRRILKQSSDEQFSSEELLKRFEHFTAESEQLIPGASDALAAGDIGEFGRQVMRSQELAESLLGNQVPETIFLACSAREAGAAAASSFGAGFGGSVWALAKMKNAQELLGRWSELYKGRFAETATNAQFFLTHPGPAAFEL